MATRYWVGGDGNWSQANYHWSNSSGGTPSASYLPTAADDVVFDANSNSGTSAFTVYVDGDSTTPSNCQDFSTSSLDGAMTLSIGATSQLDCYGSMTLPATNFIWAATNGCYLRFLATTTGKTITTNGVSLLNTYIPFLGVGGGWTLGSALTNTGNNLYFQNGTFSTNNYNISTTNFIAGASSTRSISLGSSTVTVAGTTGAMSINATTGLTWNAGTSTIICSAAAATFDGGGLTFYNVTFSGGAGTKTINSANTFSGQFLVSNAASTVVTFTANQTFTGGAQFSGTTQTVNGNFTYTGTMEFNSAAVGVKTIGGLTIQNLTITVPAVDGTTTLSLNANLTITGTLTTTNGGSTSRRVLLNSTSSGTQRTVSVGTNSLINTDFQDIAAAGTASWVFGLGYGNLGNNSGITFNSSTLYWIGGTGTWSDTTKWSTSSGGSAANAVPGPQNSVIFDANSNTGTGTFTVTATPAMSCNDFSTGGSGGALDGAMTFTMGATAQLDCYGSMTLPATNFTWTPTAGCVTNFKSTSTGKTLTTNGVSMGSVGTINFDGVGGGWTLGFALTAPSIGILNGTFNTGNFNLIAVAFNSSNSNTRAITLGSSTLTLSGTTPATFTTTTGLTWSAGTSTINCSNASPTFAGGGLTFYNVGFTSTAISGINITGNNTFNNLSFTARAAAGIGSLTFDNGASTTVNGTLTLGSGTTGVARLFVKATAIGSTHTITAATLTAMTDVDFRDTIAAGASSPWSGTRIGNCTGNTNITFTAARTVYWVSAASANWNGAVWNTSSGTTGGATTNFPLAQDSIVIDNAGLTAGNVITVNGGYNIPTLSFATRSTAATFATGTQGPQFFGDYVLSSSITTTGTGTFSFQKQSGTATITSAAVSLTQSMQIAAPNGTVRINGNLTSSATASLTLQNGTIDLTNGGAGNYTLSTGSFSSNVSNTRAITFGTGNITITGLNAVVWTSGIATNFTYTGTPTVNVTGAGTVGQTRTIAHGGTSTSGTETNSPSFNISAGADSITLTGSSTFKDLNFTGFSGTLNNSGRTVYGNLTYSATMSTVSGNGNTIFAATSGTQLLTSNGITINNGLVMQGTATVQLQDNVTLDSIRTFSITSGTLDLTKGGTANLTLSCGLFAASSSTARAITFGTGNITLTGSNTTIWTTATSTNLTVTGTPNVNCTYSGSVGTRVILPNGASTNLFNFNISAGSDALTINSSRYINSLNLTGFTGVLNSFATTNLFIYGDVTFSPTVTFATWGTGGFSFFNPSGTQKLTGNGCTIEAPITISNGSNTQLQDNVILGTTRTFTLTQGTLDLSSGNRTLSTGLFSSSNSNTRSIAFGTGNITLTGSGNGVTATIIWTTQTATVFTYTGTPTVNCTYSGSVGERQIRSGYTAGGSETNALNFNISAGTDIVNILGSNTGIAAYKNINFTGFSGLFAYSSVRYIYGNVIFSSGMTIDSTVLNGGFNFAATSGTQQITTNGLTVNMPLLFSGTSTYQFQDALTQNSTSAFTITSGTVQLKASTTNVVGSLVTTTTTTKALQSTINGTQATISQASGDVYADYITIKDSAATGGANFYATAASNGGNNTGWNFGVNFLYWVGGDGNWSDAANHWSNTSGGSPSASYLPTQNDIVLFDANSNSGTSSFIVTVDGTSNTPSLCNDFVANGTGGGALDGTMTLTMGATAQLDCYGSMTLPASSFSTSLTALSLINLKSTVTGKTITTNGVSFANTNFAFNGVGGGWTLGSALTANGQFYQAGTFNTANYTMTVNSLQRTSTTNTAILNLGSSTVTCSGTTPVNFTLSSGLTFNVGTSSISCSNASPTFAGGGLTFYDVSFTSAASGGATITGVNTYRNLTFTSRSTAGARTVNFSDNQIVNGTLTFGATNAPNTRMLVLANGRTQITVTVNGTVATLADVDFRNIVAAGTFGTWSGTRLGNFLNNSNITFAAGVNKYWNLAAGGNWSDTAWATSSGGTPNANNFPLAQDTVIIEDTGLNSGATITVNSFWGLGSITFATRTLPVTFANVSTNALYGTQLTLSSAVTLSGTSLWTFYYYGGTQTVTSAGVAFTQALQGYVVGGSLQLVDNLTTASTNTFTLGAGGLDLNNKVLTTGIFSSNNSETRSIAFGTGNITLTGLDTTVWTNATATNFTYTGTPTVNVTGIGTSLQTRTITSGTTGGTETNSLDFNISSGSDSIQLTGSSAFKNLNYTGFSGTSSLNYTSYGNLTLGAGMTISSSNAGVTFASTFGTKTITTNGVTIDRPFAFTGVGGTWAFQDALTQGSTRLFTFTNGTVQLKSGTTNTVGIFTANNSTLKYLAATTAGVQATITTADTNPVYAKYLSVKDSNATPAGRWYALTGTGNALSNNCINAGNNSGWNFIPSGAGFIPFF
jgi:hypothetical protein